MNASQEQVGGSHYKDMALPPVDFIHKNGIGYLECNVIKYVARHKKKGGKQDLEKAKHYIDLLIEKEYPLPQPHSSFGDQLMAIPRVPLEVQP